MIRSRCFCWQAATNRQNTFPPNAIFYTKTNVVSWLRLSSTSLPPLVGPSPSSRTTPSPPSLVPHLPHHACPPPSLMLPCPNDLRALQGIEGLPRATFHGVIIIISPMQERFSAAALEQNLCYQEEEGKRSVRRRS